MSNCLVTGGAGFIGCALSTGLAERFDRVVAVDKLLPQVHARQERPAALDLRVEFQQKDVTSPGSWDEILPGFKPDVVIHLAAETGTGQSLREATRHASENVVGTTAMLDAFCRHEILPRQFILSSSRAVYGEGAWVAPDGRLVYPGGRDSEQLKRREWDFPGLAHQPFAAAVTEPRPSNVYAATKLAQEHILDAWGKAFGIGVTILRLQNVYGPGQSLTNSYTGIVSLFARLAREGRSVPLYEDGAMLRDFVFVDDVAGAFHAAIAANLPGTTRFDVGSGQASPLSTAAWMLAKHYDAPEPHVSAQYRLGDVRHASCDLAPTLEHLPWRPSWPLERGLPALCEWIETQLP
ncbi:NAD-dependent epimerase/dehydratase [Bosea sp. CCNWLW174]|uniref:NAD-dependent epimerase/dehydratase family protein n=1 Tax=unclassified Bosea (in: a-proteobacteria) TaxID=2653178 RepID=UPI003014C78F